MKVRRIHHVALAHDGDSPLLGILEGACDLAVDHVEDGPGFTERMWPVGDCHLQTLEATGEGVVARSIESRGPGLHHIALEVDDVAAALADLKNRGLRVIDDEPRRGGGDTLIAFVHPSAFDGVMVELVQEMAPSDATETGRT
ncbi:MAG: VOC family protein [Acidimicrobiales bacterium]